MRSYVYVQINNFCEKWIGNLANSTKLKLNTFSFLSCIISPRHTVVMPAMKKNEFYDLLNIQKREIFMLKNFLREWMNYFTRVDQPISKFQPTIARRNYLLARMLDLLRFKYFLVRIRNNKFLTPLYDFWTNYSFYNKRLPLI